MRKKLARQWEDILLGVMKDLSLISKHLKVVKVKVNDDDIAKSPS